MKYQISKLDLEANVLRFMCLHRNFTWKGACIELENNYNLWFERYFEWKHKGRKKITKRKIHETKNNGFPSKGVE